MARVARSAYRWSEALEISGLIVGLMFLVFALDWLLPIDLRVLGILPRTQWGLVGIVCAPLLHAGYQHLTANALPLFVLLVLLFAQPRYAPEQTLAWIWLGSGVGTWLIGRGHSVHIGASALIYGLIVYLVASSWWLRNWRAMWVSIVVLIFYGGAFYGLLPQHGMVSWEGHLAGAITGFFVARLTHE